MAECRQGSHVRQLYDPSPYLRKGKQKHTATRENTRTLFLPSIICQVLWLRPSAGGYASAEPLYSQLCVASLCTCVFDNKGMSSGPVRGQAATKRSTKLLLEPPFIFYTRSSQHWRTQSRFSWTDLARLGGTLVIRTSIKMFSVALLNGYWLRLQGVVAVLIWTKRRVHIASIWGNILLQRNNLIFPLYFSFFCHCGSI